MKKIAVLLLALTLGLVSGCDGGKLGEKKEETPFEIDKAKQIVELIEKPVLELSQMEKIAKPDYGRLLQKLEPVLGDEGDEVLEPFFNEEELEKATTEDVAIKQDVFYPTVFHNGFDITDAKIVKTTKNDGAVEEELVITETYSGDNKKMKKFTRQYIYDVKNGNYVFDEFEGKLHYQGEEFAELKTELKQ